MVHTTTINLSINQRHGEMQVWTNPASKESPSVICGASSSKVRHELDIEVFATVHCVTSSFDYVSVQPAP